MKLWLLRHMIVFYETPRGFFFNYVGLAVAGFLKVTMKRDMEGYQERVDELSAMLGRADLLIELMKRGTGLK